VVSGTKRGKFALCPHCPSFGVVSCQYQYSMFDWLGATRLNTARYMDRSERKKRCVE
jgi:hypothetical protein